MEKYRFEMNAWETKYPYAKDPSKKMKRKDANGESGDKKRGRGCEESLGLRRKKNNDSDEEEKKGENMVGKKPKLKEKPKLEEKPKVEKEKNKKNKK